MASDRWTDVDAFLADLVVGPDPVLDDAVAANAAAGLPPIDVSPTHGKLLWLLARVQGARTILELGTLGGYSTIWLARALPGGGRVLSLEANAGYAEVARANVARAGLADAVEIRVGPALETLPALAAEGLAPFDLVFIDADKESTPDYFRWALELTRPGSLIVTDNVVRGGTVADPGDDGRAVAMRRFVEQLAAEPRVEATVIQTVGSKGYDGFAVALVVAA
jgi:predicted O-methyltransferase YrrM